MLSSQMESLQVHYKDASTEKKELLEKVKKLEEDSCQEVRTYT